MRIKGQFVEQYPLHQTERTKQRGYSGPNSPELRPPNLIMLGLATAGVNKLSQTRSLRDSGVTR
jgi:hypothetical protein